jgi:hypothetical protein
VERVTKLVVLAWVALALLVEIWIVSGSWPALVPASLALAGVFVALGTLTPNSVGLVLVFAYVVPTIIHLVRGGPPYAPYAAIWLVPLVAVILPSAARTPWNIPWPWRVPLVTAALVIVVAAPIVCLREMDLNPGLVFDRQGWSYVGAIWPSLSVAWILHVSLTLVIGVLWFDWLFGARGLKFRAAVVTPLVVSCAVLAAVAICQLFVDITLFNETVFASLGRASGTMYDANVSGTIAAMWIGGAYVWARRIGRLHVLLAALLIAPLWLAVWATGSRTAFAAAAAVTGFVAIAIAAAPAKDGLSRQAAGIRARRASVRIATAAVIVAIPIVLFAVTTLTSVQAIGPLRRIAATLPSVSASSLRAFASEMWNRGGYGTVAVEMIRRFPWTGIGIGTYQLLVGDYSALGPLPPDNAQNWLRHQVVELGMVGSLGWLVWFVAFAAFVFRWHRGQPADTWAIRGVLIAFAAISMLGVPGQDAMVAVTFWTMAFWYVSLVGKSTGERPTPRWVSVASAALVTAMLVGTAQSAMGALRVPVRATRAMWPYSYGFAAPDATGEHQGYRRTRGHAVAVLDPSDRWLAVTVRLQPGQTAPVDVRVWANGGTVLKARLTTADPVTTFVPAGDGPARVLLEMAARRADSWRPWFVRSAESLVLVKWEFVGRPPDNFRAYPARLMSS